MEPLTKKDLLEALEPLATKAGLASVREEMNLLATKKDVATLRRDIKLIHEDLKAHDERAEETNQIINELLDLKKLNGKLEQMRTNIREKLGVEV